MKINKLLNVIVLASLFAVLTLAVMPQTVRAQPFVCGTPGTPPCPPSGGGGGSNKPGPKNRPTQVTTIPTSVPKLLAMPTAPAGAVLIPAGGAGPNNPNSELPAVQNPDQGASPFNLPGLLGSIIAVLLILGGLFFGLFLPAIQKRSLDDGSSQFQKADGSSQFQKADGSSQFQKADGSPVKPPNPNIGDKSSGGTL